MASYCHSSISGLGQVPAQTHLLHDPHSVPPVRPTARATQSHWEEGTLFHQVSILTATLKEPMVSYEQKGRLSEVTQLALDHSVSSRESLGITPGALHFTQ